MEEASRQVEAYRSLYDASSAASGEGKVCLSFRFD